MTWIFTGLLLGSIVTSSHDSREACEGRAVLLKEKGVNGKCVEMIQFLNSNGIFYLNQGTK